MAKVHRAQELHAIFDETIGAKKVNDVISLMSAAGFEAWHLQCCQIHNQIQGQQRAIEHYKQQRKAKLKTKKMFKNIAWVFITIMIIVVSTKILQLNINIQYMRALRGYNYLTAMHPIQKHSIQSSSLSQTRSVVDVIQLEEFDAEKCKEKLQYLAAAYKCNSETQKDIFDGLQSKRLQKTSLELQILGNRQIEVFYCRMYVLRLQENKYLFAYGAVNMAYTSDIDITRELIQYIEEKVPYEAIRRFKIDIAKPEPIDFVEFE